MAILINGNGNKAIWAQQDADLIAALAGNVTGIAKVGNKFEATQEDANTIGLSDGVIVTKEGRRIQLDVGSVDLFDIPTGTAGVTSYYIIGYHLITNSDSSQECETFVQKMDNATDVITENTFRGGASEVYVSCYRVVQDGLNIDSINALLPELENISTLINESITIIPVNISTESTQFIISGTAFILNNQYLFVEITFNGKYGGGNYYLSTDTQNMTPLANIELPAGYSIPTNAANGYYQFAGAGQGPNYQHGHVDIFTYAGSGKRQIYGIATSGLTLIREGSCTFIVPVIKS